MKMKTNMDQENRNRIMRYLSILISDYHLNPDDDTYERDTSLFRSVFPSDSIHMYEIEKEGLKSATFNIRNMNGLKIKFERIEIEDNFFNYSIVLSSPLVGEESLNLISEIEIARNRHDRKYCSELLNSFFDELYYYTMQFEDMETKFKINETDKLIFSKSTIINTVNPEYMYGSSIFFDDGKEKREIHRDEALDIIQKKYNLTGKIKGFILRVAELNIQREKEKLLRSINNDIVSFNGEEMINAMKESGNIDKELLRMAVSDTLKEMGFYSSFPETLTDSFVDREYIFNEELLDSVERTRDRFRSIEFTEAEEMLDDMLDLNNPSSNKNNGVRVYNYFRNSGVYFRDIVSQSKGRKAISDTYRARCTYRIKDRDTIDPYVASNRLLRGIDGVVYNGLIAPFLLSNYIMPEFIKIFEKTLKMCSNPYIKKETGEDNIPVIEDVINRIRNGSMKVEDIRLAMNGAAKIFEVTARISKNMNFLLKEKKKATESYEDYTKKIMEQEKMIKPFMMPGRKNEIKERIEQLKAKAYEMKELSEKKDKDYRILSLMINEYKKDDINPSILSSEGYRKPFSMMTPKEFILLGERYESTVSSAFVEFPITALENDFRSSSDFYIRSTGKNGEQVRTCHSRYLEREISHDLNEYIQCAFDMDFSIIPDDNSYASVMKEYFINASQCRTIDELDTVINNVFYDKDMCIKKQKDEIELSI